GLLTPTFIDPDSGYRYYAFEQSNDIEIIMFCAFLGIPLKELPGFIGGEIMDYRAFLAYGKKIAGDKIKSLKNGLKLIDKIEKQMDLAERYEIGQIYPRDIPEKYFICKPCRPPLNEIDRFEMVMSFSDVFAAAEGRDDLAEYGFLRQNSPAGAQYYAFMEIAKEMANSETIIIPAATYFCRQDQNLQIENAHQIFNKHLAGANSFIAIETEILTSKPKISNPINELRVAKRKTQSPGK
ncbi:MAG: hypothetical protein FWB71_06050, partial [Defluviitaleaceae bacterium]|nr:hypothetical protein [Defluviitaleaceae bacterium]